MMRQNLGSRTLAALLLGSLVPSLVPRVAAEEGAPAPAIQQSPRSLRAAASATVARADVSHALQTPSSPSPATEPGKPFFKTTRGIVTAVLMAGGLGWVIYTTSHDRVRSPADK